MKAFAFETGKTYGNEFTFTVISRTEKTLTIDARHWGKKVRVKLRSCYSDKESILFKCWLVSADEFYNREIAAEISMNRD